MAHDVFVSYRHEDEEWAGRVCQALEAQEIACWVAFRDIESGADWPTAIVNALKSSRFFVILLSSHSVNEDQISREVRIAADELRLPLFPVRLEDVQSPAKLNYFLGGIQHLDAFGGKFESAMQQLTKRIRERSSAPTHSPATATPVIRATNDAQPRPKSSPLIWMSVGAAVVIVIAAIVIMLRPHRVLMPRQVSDVSSAFLGDLSRGDFEAAWKELTPAHENHLNFDKWMKEHEANRAKDGPFAPKLMNCEAQATPSAYRCNFLLTYLKDNKTSAAWVEVAKEDNGAFGVENSNLGEKK